MGSGLKELFSVVAIGLTFIAFFPYIRSIMLGQTKKPHVFSWIIWGSTTFIVFLAQFEEGGGVGAWPIGISGLITLYVAFLAYRTKSDITISSIDWVFFIMALMSLPIWYFTSDSLWAVVILTAIDVVGFGPTIRKAFVHPYDEDLRFFLLFMMRNTLVVMALEHYSLTTVLFPAVIAGVCLIFILMVVHRRLTLNSSKNRGRS
ncbi:MAG: hypothetical protein KZQ78_11440 [Candidatus Thiodiazotropha sp. (ex Ustalcina ferruginea)]|nr:hypothetical protein [Candidatus Thiodiazotropha sp. (ex Ustalcina ferruginea)]